MGTVWVMLAVGNLNPMSKKTVTLLIMHVQMMAESQMMAVVLQWWIDPGTSVNLCGNSSVLKRD